jgi:hypothetical protein
VTCGGRALDTGRPRALAARILDLGVFHLPGRGRRGQVQFAGQLISGELRREFFFLFGAGGELASAASA